MNSKYAPNLQPLDAKFHDPPVGPRRKRKKALALAHSAYLAFVDQFSCVCCQPRGNGEIRPGIGGNRAKRPLRDTQASGVTGHLRPAATAGPPDSSRPA